LLYEDAVKNILVPALMLLFFIALGVALSSHSQQLTRTGLSGPEMAPPLPAKLAFAGEDVPLSYFWVAEGYDRELLVNMHWHSSTIMLLKRAHRYLPVIEPILKEEGVPDDFKYLAVIESNLLPAVSPAGATGIWQFLKKTGQAYGLRINDDVDERYHLEKATVAACRYLKKPGIPLAAGPWLRLRTTLEYRASAGHRQNKRQAVITICG
jgi:hypothetical protein